MIPPQIEYRQKMTLNLGERTFELMYLKGVHSEADTAVWLPKERVLFSASAVVVNQYNILRPFVTIPDILAAAKMMKGLNPEVPARARTPVSPASGRSPRARSHNSAPGHHPPLIDDAHRSLGLRHIQSGKNRHGSSPFRLTRSRICLSPPAVTPCALATASLGDGDHGLYAVYRCHHQLQAHPAGRALLWPQACRECKAERASPSRSFACPARLVEAMTNAAPADAPRPHDRARLPARPSGTGWPSRPATRTTSSRWPSPARSATRGRGRLSARRTDGQAAGAHVGLGPPTAPAAASLTLGASRAQNG